MRTESLEEKEREFKSENSPRECLRLVLIQSENHPITISRPFEDSPTRRPKEEKSIRPAELQKLLLLPEQMNMFAVATRGDEVSDE